MLPVYNWGSLCCRATAQGPPGAAAATRPRRPWLSLSKVTLMATGGTAAVMNSSEIRHQTEFTRRGRLSEVDALPRYY